MVPNNWGVEHAGLGTLLPAGRIARVTASYVRENREFARQYLAGIQLCRRARSQNGFAPQAQESRLVHPAGVDS